MISILVGVLIGLVGLILILRFGDAYNEWRHRSSNHLAQPTTTPTTTPTTICQICGERRMVLMVTLSRLDIDPHAFPATKQWKVPRMKEGNQTGWDDKQEVVYLSAAEVCDDCRTIHWVEPKTMEEGR
jgi:hypothetical protein